MQFQSAFFLGLLTMMALLTSHETMAQDIETLVMPGEVVNAHADLESECSSCHKMFDKQRQRQLCLDCHEEVADDLSQRNGYHGLRSEIGESQCSSCHTDHEGRDAVIVVMDEDTFDHGFTDFELNDAHADASCKDCHEPDTKHRDAGPDCIDCHREDEPHENTMGSECATCHQSETWLEAEFDHDTTNFLLLGKHRQSECLDCHENRTFAKPATSCFGCHAEDDAHNGRSGDACENCHNPTDWSDSSFDHSRDTDFRLTGRHADLLCADCHSNHPFEDEMSDTCVSCHSHDDEHDKHRGDQCNNCHSNSDWARPLFDHDKDTAYRLIGGHQSVTCNDCHVEPIFDVALTTTCESCHLDDDAHEKSLGTQCENCHTEVNWQDPLFFDHDLSAFPLLGKHAEAECKDCHSSQVFPDTQSDCISCHRDDDSHRGKFDDRCASCHNPVAWDAWDFDHQVNTNFPLHGAHTDIACNDCHRSALVTMSALGSNCGSCHRASDLHDGEFGPDCGRCHSENSFSDVRSVQ